MAIGRIPEPGTGIPESIIAAKGDILTGTANDVPAVLTAGANETRLVADSGEATGLKYVADTTNYAVAAKGDLLVGTAADTVAPLTVGTNGHTLVADSSTATGLKWQAPAGGSTFVGVSVWHDANQTTSNNTDLVLAMNQEVFDTDGFHSTTTNNSRLTVPAGKAGKYFVRGLIAYDYDADGYRDVRIFKNGSLVSVTRMQPPTGDTYGAIQEGSYILDLAEGDYIQLIARQVSGGNLIAQTAGSSIYPQLQMFLIGA